MTISDEELAEIAFGAINFTERWDNECPMQKQMFTDIARAVREALTEPVTPLAPGETVTIACTVDPVGSLGIRDLEGVDATHELRVDIDGSEGGATVWIDAAGVRALRLACDRFLATNGGE